MLCAFAFPLPSWNDYVQRAKILTINWSLSSVWNIEKCANSSKSSEASFTINCMKCFATGRTRN